MQVAVDVSFHRVLCFECVLCFILLPNWKVRQLCSWSATLMLLCALALKWHRSRTGGFVCPGSHARVRVRCRAGGDCWG